MAAIPIVIRLARPTDRTAIVDLHRTALRALSRGYLGPAAIDAFLAGVGTFEDDLLGDRTYFVASVDERIIACGGWSLRKPCYASAIAGFGVPGAPIPTVRAMYVDPAFARRGLGRAVLRHVESAIIAAGRRRAELVSSPMGLAFYERCGWTRLETVRIRLADGIEIESHRMAKLLAPPPALAEHSSAGLGRHAA